MGFQFFKLTKKKRATAATSFAAAYSYSNNNHNKLASHLGQFISTMLPLPFLLHGARQARQRLQLISLHKLGIFGCTSSNNNYTRRQNAVYLRRFSSNSDGINDLPTSQTQEETLGKGVAELDIFEDTFKRSLKEEHVFIIQPDFKWGKGRFLSKAVNSRLDEAAALVQTVTNWKVQEGQIESMHEINAKHYFGSGKLKELQNKIGQLRHSNKLTGVFINVGKLSRRQTSHLEEAFKCSVYDRYKIVLEIFKERAKTKEAKLQVKLAELIYERWHLSSDNVTYDQQRGGTMSVGGSGETHLEMKRRLLNEKEAKIRKELRHIENQRKQNRTERVNKHVPQIALIGYTNAGKTTLARALSGDAKLEPEDRLFATLDTTAHRGKLPCGLGVIYIDTVGFISDLPHELIQSFSATLEDVKNSTLLVHVRDMTNPEYELQKQSVMQVLQNLEVDANLLQNMVEVHNKADLRY
eukprot:gene12597-3301_t